MSEAPQKDYKPVGLNCFSVISRELRLQLQGHVLGAAQVQDRDCRDQGSRNSREEERYDGC